MRRTLTQQERARLKGRVAEAEARTGAQLVVAVIDRCDAYPELPWKAFALGVATTSLAAWAVALTPLVAAAAPYADAAKESETLIGLVNGLGLQAAVHPTRENKRRARATLARHVAALPAESR